MAGVVHTFWMNTYSLFRLDVQFLHVWLLKSLFSNVLFTFGAFRRSLKSAVKLKLLSFRIWFLKAQPYRIDEWAKRGLKRIRWLSSWQQKVGIGWGRAQDGDSPLSLTLCPTQLACSCELPCLILPLPPSTVPAALTVVDTGHLLSGQRTKAPKQRKWEGKRACSASNCESDISSMTPKSVGKKRII